MRAKAPSPDRETVLCYRRFFTFSSPRRLSVVVSSPSSEMAGMKFFTRSISSANASSMSVPFVKLRNSHSGCRSQSVRMSFLRTSGSPPV